MYRRQIQITRSWRTRFQSFATAEGGNTTTSRGNETKGAMQNFINKATTKSEGSASPLWSRLVKDLTPPPQPSTAADRRQGVRKTPGVRPAGFGRPSFRGPTEGGEEGAAAGAGGKRRLRNRASDDGEDGGDGEDEGDDYRRPKIVEQEPDPFTSFDLGAAKDDVDDDIEDYNEGPAKRASLGHKVFVTKKMSDVDALFANAVLESHKNRSGKYMTILQSEDFQRTVIPKARSVKQMLYTTLPDITLAKPGTPGYTLAEQAFGVMSQSAYFTPAMKQQVVDEVSVRQNAVLAAVAKGAKTNSLGGAEAYDPIFRFGFRKGLEAIEEEQRQKAVAEGRKVVANNFVQGETDWAVEAAEDEDSLGGK